MRVVRCFAGSRVPRRSCDDVRLLEYDLLCVFSVDTDRTNREIYRYIGISDRSINVYDDCGCIAVTALYY